MNEKKLLSNVTARYLHQPGEGGTKKATDPIWTLKVSTLEIAVTNLGVPVIYHLRDDSKRGLVREELLVVPLNAQLPPSCGTQRLS